MKKNTLSYSLNLFILLFISSFAFAQVGINTTNPKGVLDFNSTTLGVVYPNVALVATDDPTQVVNPQGGTIVAGTVVYNTNTTTTGATTDVFPGIYVWNGMEWIVHYKKRQSELFNQSSLLRTEAVGGWQDIPGLGTGSSFTAKYSGLYRIEVKTNFAGGRTETNNTTFVSIASGQFRFQFDGTPYTYETSAISAYSSYINSGTHFEGIWKETYETNYVSLIAGQNYPFSLDFDASDALGFIGNGSTTTAPTEVVLIDEEFEAYADPVPQDFTADAQCPTQGWETSTLRNCAPCLGKWLYIDANSNNCAQDATAYISFTPLTNSVDINFDYLFRERKGTEDSFRVYIDDGTTELVELFLINDTSNTHVEHNDSYIGSVTVVANTPYFLRFEYINIGPRSGTVSVDNVLITELSGPVVTVDEGRGYVGNQMNCQIEFTYIGE